MLNMARYGTIRFNESLQSLLQSLSNPSVEKYKLSLHDMTGGLITSLPLFYGGKSSETVNGIGTLSFSYPLYQDEASAISFPYQVWLTDAYGSIMEKYHILQTETQMTTEGNYVLGVECESLISQLGNELISYDTTGSTIRDILSDWFHSYQVAGAKIFLGSIDPSIGNEIRAITLDQESILEGIQQLADTVNQKVYYVDPITRKFNWKNRRGNYQGKHISLGFNLAGMRIRQDNTKIINRVFVYGEDDTDFKKGLNWAGFDNDYLESESSISQFGIRQGKFVLKNAKYPSQLINFAYQALNTYSYPSSEIEIDTLDLMNTGQSTNDFMRFRPGQEVRLNHPVLGMDNRIVVIEISRNLDSPLDMKLTLANRIPSLNTVFEELGKRLRIEENSPSPTTENTIDALDDVVHTDIDDGELEPHPKRDQLISTIADAVAQTLNGLDDESESDEVQDSAEDLINRILQAVKEMLENHSGETITQEFIDALAQELGQSDILREALKDCFIPYYVAESLESLPGDVEAIAIGFVIDESHEDENDGKIFKRNSSNNDWVPIGGNTFISADNKSELEDLMPDDGTIGYTTGTTKRFYARIDEVLICLTHLE